MEYVFSTEQEEFRDRVKKFISGNWTPPPPMPALATMTPPRLNGPTRNAWLRMAG